MNIILTRFPCNCILILIQGYFVCVIHGYLVCVKHGHIVCDLH